MRSLSVSRCIPQPSIRSALSDCHLTGTFLPNNGCCHKAPEEEIVMKPIASIFVAAAISAMAMSTAVADCPEAAKKDAQAGIAKDGSKAPMQDSANSTTQTGAASVGTTDKLQHGSQNRAKVRRHYAHGGRQKSGNISAGCAGAAERRQDCRCYGRCRQGLQKLKLASVGYVDHYVSNVKVDNNCALRQGLSAASFEM